MKKKTFLFITLSIWIITVLLLIAIRHQLRNTFQVSEYSRAAKAFFESLDPAIKGNISHFETAIIKLSDGSFRMIGAGFEPELETLRSERRLNSREIDFIVADPIALERRMMAGEAFKTLNNAEKKCFIDGFGVVLFQNGSYHFICDAAVYLDYVKKFGTECKPCEELKRLRDAGEVGKNR